MMDSIKNRKPILVTGSHRSGSTWVGQLLASAPSVGYLHEPFNIQKPMGLNPKPFNYWFQYIYDSNINVYEKIIGDILKFKYPLKNHLPRIRNSRDVARLVRNYAIMWNHNVRRHRPLLKDPLSLLSAEWLSETFDMNVIVLIRHPAAFCSSLKIKGWSFDFNNFLNQPKLMAGPLKGFHSEIEEYANQKKTLIEQAALLWNCFHHIIQIYKKNHQNWLFVKHETLSRDPENEFNILFQQLGLKFTDKARKKILASTGANNPSEQTKGKEFLRNSKTNIHNWRTRLSQKEIRLIRKQTEAVANQFYSASDW